MRRFRAALPLAKGKYMKRLGTPSLFFFVFVCVFSTSGTSPWSDKMGGGWNNPTRASIWNIINDQLWNRVFAKARARDKARGQTGQAETTTETTRKTPAEIDAAVRFRSTGTQLETQAIADELGAGGTPEAKKQMFAVLSTLLT